MFKTKSNYVSTKKKSSGTVLTRTVKSLFTITHAYSSSFSNLRSKHIIEWVMVNRLFTCLVSTMPLPFFFLKGNHVFQHALLKRNVCVCVRESVHVCVCVCVWVYMCVCEQCLSNTTPNARLAVIHFSKKENSRNLSVDFFFQKAQYLREE